MHKRLVIPCLSLGICFALGVAFGMPFPLRAEMRALTPSPAPTRPAPEFWTDRGPALPAPACGLVVAQVVCYDGYQAAPHPTTPPNQQVIDFAIAPDGNWIVYRAASTVTIAAVDGNTAASQPVDTQATPPAELSLTDTTIAWAPDGITLAYVTANGFRVVFPLPGGGVRRIEVTERAAVNLRFSPGGGRLAVQSDDGSWTLFEVQAVDSETGSNVGNGTSATDARIGMGGEQVGLTRTRLIDQAADVAWLDDTSLIVAPVAGGLMRLDASDPALAPAWSVPGEHFTKLFTASSGEVLALHPDPGDTIGSVVSIDGGGTVKPLGQSKIDAMAEWGPDGAMLYYITSGTPILIDRATGSEDMLSLTQITRLIWDAPGPTPVSSLPLDADLYFVAPGDGNIRQVWRLPRSGLEMAAPVTRQTADVQDYAVSQDGSQITIKSGNEQTIVSLAGTPIPPEQRMPPAAAPDLQGVRLSVDDSQSSRQWIIRDASGKLLVQSAWPILDMTVSAGGSPGDPTVRFLRHVGWPLGPATIRLYVPSADPGRPEARSRFGVLSSPQLSPSGRFAVGVQGSGAASQLIILDLQSGREALIRDVNGVSLIKWVP